MMSDLPWLRRLAAVLALTLALLAGAQEDPFTVDLGAIEHEKREPGHKVKMVARAVALLTQRFHYSQPPIDDEVSRQLFAAYFDTLDPNHQYFLASDVEGFLPYRDKLDDMIRNGDIEFAFVVYERFLQRVRERAEYVRRRVREPFDFTLDETLTTDREELPRPRTIEEQNELWRKLVKFQLLTNELVDRQQEKEAAEKQDEEYPEGMRPSEAAERPKLTPEQRVFKDYVQRYRYLSQNDTDDVLELYLTTMTTVFDPHSTYLNWRTLEDFDISMRLSLQGIGATLTSVDGYTKVVSLVKGGPAMAGGKLQPGDYILAVAQEGEPSENVVNIPLNKVVRKIRGKKGTPVTLTVAKQPLGIPRDIRIVRDQVKLTEQEAKSQVIAVPGEEGEPRHVGVIKLPSFYVDFEGMNSGKPDYTSTSRDVRRLVDQMLENQDIASLVVDLRGNGGGSLEEAIKLAGLFVPAGPVVQIRAMRQTEVRKDEDGDFAYDLPLLVMTDHASASASEIFAGAIQDYDRGIIFGDSGTHGKGTVQSVRRLRDFNSLADLKPGALKFTMAKFYRITGNSTQLRGVTPHLVVPSILDYLELGEKNTNNPLPWDEIDEQRFDPSGAAVSRYTGKLKELSQARLAVDEKFQRLLQDIEHYGERRRQKTVSLNRQERLEQYKKDEFWRERSQEIYRSSGQDTAGAEEQEEPEEEEDPHDHRPRALTQIDDLYLKEAVQVARDLAQLSAGDRAVAARETPRETP